MPSMEMIEKGVLTLTLFLGTLFTMRFTDWRVSTTRTIWLAQNQGALFDLLCAIGNWLHKYHYALIIGGAWLTFILQTVKNPYAIPGFAVYFGFLLGLLINWLTIQWTSEDARKRMNPKLQRQLDERLAQVLANRKPNVEEQIVLERAFWMWVGISPITGIAAYIWAPAGLYSAITVALGCFFVIVGFNENRYGKNIQYQGFGQFLMIAGLSMLIIGGTLTPVVWNQYFSVAPFGMYPIPIR